MIFFFPIIYAKGSIDDEVGKYGHGSVVTYLQTCLKQIGWAGATRNTSICFSLCISLSFRWKFSSMIDYVWTNYNHHLSLYNPNHERHSRLRKKDLIYEEYNAKLKTIQSIQYFSRTIIISSHLHEFHHSHGFPCKSFFGHQVWPMFEID